MPHTFREGFSAVDLACGYACGSRKKLELTRRVTGRSLPEKNWLLGPDCGEREGFGVARTPPRHQCDISDEDGAQAVAPPTVFSVSWKTVKLGRCTRSDRRIRVALRGLFERRFRGISEIAQELFDPGIGIRRRDEAADRGRHELGIAPVRGIEADRIAKRLHTIGEPQLREVDLPAQERELRALGMRAPRLGDDVERRLEILVCVEIARTRERRRDRIRRGGIGVWMRAASRDRRRLLARGPT